MTVSPFGFGGRLRAHCVHGSQICSGTYGSRKEADHLHYHFAERRKSLLHCTHLSPVLSTKSSRALKLSSVPQVQRRGSPFYKENGLSAATMIPVSILLIRLSDSSRHAQSGNVEIHPAPRLQITPRARTTNVLASCPYARDKRSLGLLIVLPYAAERSVRRPSSSL